MSSGRKCVINASRACINAIFSEECLECLIIAISLGTDEVVGNIFVWFFIINSLLTIRVLIQFIIEL